jgi:hypothetical protein
MFDLWSAMVVQPRLDLAAAATLVEHTASPSLTTEKKGKQCAETHQEVAAEALKVSSSDTAAHLGVRPLRRRASTVHLWNFG